MTFRALIFDLDDTLIDTCGQLVPKAHYQSCIAMHQAGLDIPVDTLFETRMSLLESHPRAEINQLLAEHYGQSTPEIIQAGYETYFNPEITELDLMEGAQSVLEKSKDQADLFLVTSGYEKTQSKKVSVLGIAPYFKDIYYVDIKNAQGKKEAFENILNAHAYHPKETVVIGDRINNEIVAANQLGIPTLWIQRGECRGITPETPDEIPTHTIQDIADCDSALQILARKI